MVCTSVYDTKPVHFISMYRENIGWVVKERKFWSNSQGKFTMMKFPWFNQSTKHNFEMNDVSVEDQLRLFYRFDVKIGIASGCGPFFMGIVLMNNAWI